MDILKKLIIQAVAPALGPVSSALDFIDSYSERMDYQPSVRKFLADYGKYQIKELVIERTKVNSFITRAINFASLNQVDESIKKYGYDRLYHLDLKFKFTDRLNKDYHYKLEKNEVIYINPWTYDKNTQSMPVNLNNQNITIEELLNKTLHRVGDEAFFKYDFQNNNCQTFILNILDSNNLLTPQYRMFIYQNIPQVFNTTNKYVKQAMNYSTRIGAKFNRMIKGRGLILA